MKKHGIVFFLISGISVVSLFLLRFLLGGWIDYLFVPLAFALFSFVAGLWSYRKLFREFFTLKTTKEGMSMGATILMVISLLIAVNYLGARNYKTFDFSASQVNTLSEQSKVLLKNLKDELKVIYFYKRGTEGVEENRRAFIDLIKKYQDASGLVKLQFVEVNENPGLAEEYGINKGTGVVFVEYKGRRNKIEKIDEQELTGALVKVTREKDKKIYMTTGHRERDLADSKEGTGLFALKQLLEGNRYLVSPLQLTQSPEIPADADLVIVAGPEQSFLEQEVQTLERYLQRGGSLILALEPTPDVGLTPLLQNLGVRMTGKFVAQVVDTPMGKAVNPQVTPASQFSEQAVITRPFRSGEFVLFRLPTPLQSLKTPESLAFEELVKTDGNAMAFEDTKFKGGAESGPFVLAALVKGKFPGGKSSKEFNLVVFGDVDFLSNQLLYKNLNRDMALNSVAFLAKEENVISITPKEVDVTKLQITEMQFYLFIFGFIIPLPLLLIVVSGVLWYRRRFA